MPRTQQHLFVPWIWLAVALPGNLLLAQPAAKKPANASNAAEPAKPVAVKEYRGKPRQTDEESDPSTLRGVVRDPSGRSAAKANVWLVVRRGEVFDPPLKSQADESGWFSFAKVDVGSLLARGDKVAILARDTTGNIGWHNLSESDRDHRLREIRLRESASLTGRILDGDGRPLAGARLTPKSFREPRAEGAASTGDESISLWPELAAEYSSLTAADGTFEVAGVPRAIQARCQVAADEVEKAEVVIESGIAATVRLGEPGSIAGQVKPPDADPRVEGFQLRIYLQTGARQPQEPAVHLADAVAVDKNGRFRFVGLPPGRYTIHPVESQQAPFFAEPTRPLALQAGQHLDGVVIPLTACREVKSRVVDGRTGQGIAAVEVSVSNFGSGLALRSQSVETDAGGAFSTWTTPGNVHVFVRRVPVEYLLPHTESGNGIRDFAEAPLIELDRAAMIEGIVVDEEGNPVPLARLDIERMVLRSGQWQAPPAQADPSGRFVAKQLEPSEPLVLRARSSTAATESPTTIVPAELDGPVRLVVSPKHACWLSGQVVDRRGNPIPGASVAITSSRQIATTFPAQSMFRQLNSVSVRQAATDGTFETGALFPGDYQRLAVTAPGYGGRLSDNVQGEPGRLYDFGPIVLDAFASFTGQVVDAAGNPVADAELRVVLPDGSPNAGAGVLELYSDEAGQFELPPASVDGVLRIWARAGELLTDGPASFFPDQISGPLKIELAEKRGFRAAGRVVDIQGKPVHASVAIVWQFERNLNRTSVVNFVPGIRRPPVKGGPISLGSAVVDDSGRFLTGSLWPGQQYGLAITAEGYQAHELAVASGRDDLTIDAGQIVLRRGNLAVEGEVVDANGQPVAGATVFSSGDAPEPVTVETDAAGRFRLTGLFDGPAYFLIRKAGYWPAGLRCTAGEVGKRVRLVDSKRPRPESRLPPRRDEGPSPKNRELALRLLDELWQLRDQYTSRNQPSSRFSRSSRGVSGPRGGDVIRHLASLDYALALKWSAAEGEAFDEMVRIRAFPQLVGDDVNRAIAQAGAPGGSRALKAMAKRRLAAGAPDDAMRLLEAALHANLNAEYPSSESHPNIVSQVEIGAMAIAAGRDEWGRRLVNEAADQTERLGGETNAATRAAVATALASYDSPRSVRVWEMLPAPKPGGPDASSYITDLAVSVGVHDLKAGQRIASRQSSVAGVARRAGRQPAQSSDFDPILVRIARRLARTHPERALELLDKVGESQWLEKAEALARVAMALAPRDGERAFGLIDQALGLCFSSPGRSTIDNSAETAARIALMAAEAGYPDIRTLVDQTLALRLTPTEQPPAAGRSALRRTAMSVDVAWVLAILDPELARDLLSRLAPPAANDLNDDTRQIGRWLQAWAMVDVEHSVTLFHQVLETQGGAITEDLVRYGLLPMIDSLLWSHKDFVNMVLQRHPSSWIAPPGAED